MSDKPENPLAFSQAPHVFLGMGMTLRDYFAASVIQGMYATGWDNTKESMAEEAYSQADAMLKERQK